MSLWLNAGRVGRNLLAGTAMTLVMTGVAHAEFPGEVWGVSYVQVTGNGAPATANAVNLGLKRANDIYFYGDRPTRMEANVRSDNSFDLRLVDLDTGNVVASQSALPYGGDDIAENVTQAALAWMEGLTCGAGCADAGAAAPVQVAAAPQPVPQEPEPEPEPAVTQAEPEPEPEAQPAPQPEPQPVLALTEPVPAPVPVPVIAQAEPVRPAAVAAAAQPTPVRAAIVAPDPEPEVQLALSEPTVSTPRRAVAAAPVDLSNQSTEELVRGLDADAVLAAVATPTPAAAAALPAATPAPQVASPSLVATTPAITAPVAEAPVAQIATALPTPRPAPVAAPAEAETVVALAQPTVREPAAAAPVVAAPAAPAVTQAPAVATPVVTRPAAPAAQAEVGLNEPSVTEPSLNEPSLNEPTTGSGGGVIAPRTQETPEAPVRVTALPTSDPEPQSTAIAEAPAVASAVAAVETAVPAAAAPVAAAPAAVPSAVAAVPEILLAEPPDPGAPEPSTPASTEDAGVGQLALANPRVPDRPAAPVARDRISTAVAPEPVPEITGTPELAPTAEAPATVETRLAAVDPQQSGPTLANARWVGFTPAVFTGADTRPGAWIAGPFDRKQRSGWITDTATGATTRVTFYWRDAASGSRTATLSREAAAALGVGQGDVANVAVYLPR